MSDLQEFTIADGHCLEHGHFTTGITRRYAGDKVMLSASEGLRLQKLGILDHPRRKVVSAYGGRGKLLFIDGKSGERVGI